eukprot:142955-Karenia_brevis.AAC.1
MSKKRSDEEIARIVSMVVQAVMPQIQRPSSEGRSEQSEQRSRVVLDEKHLGGWISFQQILQNIGCVCLTLEWLWAK